MRESQLIDAIFNKDVSLVKEILKNEYIDINWVDEYENTPLLVAIEVGDVEMIETLLLNGADPNFPTTRLPLITAIDSDIENVKNDSTIESFSISTIQLLLK